VTAKLSTTTMPANRKKIRARRKPPIRIGSRRALRAFTLGRFYRTGPDLLLLAW